MITHLLLIAGIAWWLTSQTRGELFNIFKAIAVVSYSLAIAWVLTDLIFIVIHWLATISELL